MTLAAVRFPWMFDVARGYLSPRYGDMKIAEKFAFDVNVAAFSLEDVHDHPDPLYVYPSDSGDDCEVISSSSEDAAGGTGAKGLIYEYMDVSGVWNELPIIPTGTAGAPFPPKVRRARRGWVTGDQDAAGIIDLRRISDGQVFARLSAPRNQTIMSQDTVPAGHRAYLISLWGGNLRATDQVLMELYQRELGGVFRASVNFPTGHGNSFLPIDGAKNYPPFTDLVVRAANTFAGVAKVGASYVYALVPETP